MLITHLQRRSDVLSWTFKSTSNVVQDDGAGQRLINKSHLRHVNITTHMNASHIQTTDGLQLTCECACVCVRVSVCVCVCL